ncbi:Hypothetical_protein [Hexamita inflata]|uniref:Hypothetical_protein n=1 Tax=Hexamita inflata TaxID=28002 RepID=A0AA86TQB6_9EUKA|nr:Hypothetical protein HINF_LOCUS12421 [Hexamita inflata]
MIAVDDQQFEAEVLDRIKVRFESFKSMVEHFLSVVKLLLSMQLILGPLSNSTNYHFCLPQKLSAFISYRLQETQNSSQMTQTANTILRHRLKPVIMQPPNLGSCVDVHVE